MRAFYSNFYEEYTDMRKSIDGLCAVVEQQLHMNPRKRALYPFCEKRCDRVKALLWEGDGFVSSLQED